MIYLACPYSHPDPAVREARFHAVNRAAGQMIANGLLVFSPISHSHPIAVDCDLPSDFGPWAAFDHAMIAACSRVVVLKLDGWDRSAGIAEEVAHAIATGKDVEYMEPEGVTA
jgi:hypothetical protein